MDKIYDHRKNEEKIYKNWEEKGYFKPEINPKGKPFSIILPPPNANAPLHFGHAMYVIEDVLARFNRMQGKSVLWLPGADHAGFETQFVFEKHLKERGQSRFDFERGELYKKIWDFVQDNRGGMETQLRKLGFSLDWSRLKFTLDPDVVSVVYRTFKKMHRDGLVYRAERLVNYCTFDGTSFSDLEVVHEERETNLYFIKYPLTGGGYVTVATTRPETMLGDTAVAVNTKDERFKSLIGKTLFLPLTEREIPIVGDNVVSMEFGTGAVKVTPAHDPVDFEIGERHNLPKITVIGYDGKINKTGNSYEGLYIKEAREKIIKDLEERGLIEKVERIKHQAPLCYKCKRTIEPLLAEQWFIKMQPLAEKGLRAVKKGEVKIYPKNFEKIYFQFLENIKDWNISRQIVWGIRIPAWKCANCMQWTITEGEVPRECSSCSSGELSQDVDTFDTWFSSSQWPFATLETSKSGDFEKFYPTSVMETGYDILRWWVARMVMVGIYATGKVPFRDIVLHGLVNDPLGKKMSKSKGNVVNPMDLIGEYGADAVRMALVYGTALGHDQALSYPKIQSMRNFSNKLWNIGRFILMKREALDPKSEIRSNLTIEQLSNAATNPIDKEWIEKTERLTANITRSIEKYNFNFAAQELYEFVWHEFADKYIEDVKNRMDEKSFLVLYSLFFIQLKLLHPFMPFITEEIADKLGKKEDLIISSWPK